MSKKFYSDLKLGVLGGGQLGRMFIQDALNFNLNILVLDPDPEAPCKNIANEFTVGDLLDFETVYQFGKKVDLITIEIEHVNIEALEALEKEGVIVFPQPRVLRIVQDKGLQKNFYKENGIATADYFLVDNKKDIADFTTHFPFMQKLRKGGYDGKGVTKLHDTSNFDHAFDAPSVLEKFVDFEKEISVIVARNSQGEIKTYPLVELDFNPEANLVEFLFSPANVAKHIETKAAEIAIHVAEALKIVGILAVEMFLTKSGEILVNEIAPRPHNSGHHSIEANYTSQYEQHLRAILNLPLGATSISSAAVMVNLLGEKEHYGNVVYAGLEEVLAMEGVKLHLYGKKTTKPFRKMGHITVLGKTLQEAKEKAIIVKDKLKAIS